MQPDFDDGDLVLVAPRAPVVTGRVVVARHPYKNLMVIKRVAVVDPDGFLRLSSPGGEDSDQFGRVPVASTVGVVTINLTKRRTHTEP